MEAAAVNYSDEEPGGIRRKVFFLTTALWFLLCGCVLVLRAASLARHRSPGRSVASLSEGLAALWRRAGPWLFVGAADGPSAKQVEWELQKRRLVRAHASVPYATVAVAIVLVMALQRATRPVPRRNSATQDVCLMVVCFTILGMWAFPRIVTLRSLDMFSSIIVAGVAVGHSPVGQSATEASIYTLLPFAATMLACLLNMNIRLNIVWLCVTTISVCSSIMSGSDEDCLPARMDRISHILAAVAIFAMLVVFLHISASLVAQYENEAHTSRNELKAARSVLRCVCDAVVELDSDFRLQDGSPELVDMLLLNPQRPILGEYLTSHLATDQDRQKFSEQMARAWLLSEDAVSLSAAFHVAMKDSSSIPLDVEMFCMRFVNREGHPAYFVGIREFTDTCPMLREDTTRMRHGGRLGRLQRASSADSGGSVPAMGGSVPSSQGSSVNSEDASLDSDGLSKEDPMVWVDVLSPNCTVQHETSTFAQHVDSREGFLNAMRPSQRHGFIDWAQASWCMLLEDGPGPAQLQYPTRIHFKPSTDQSGLARRMQTRQGLSALLGLDLAPPPDGRPRGRGVVRVVLREAELGGAAAGASRRRPRRSSGTPQAIAEAASGRLEPPRAARELPRPAAAGGTLLEERPEAGRCGSEPRPPGHWPVAL
ncbi:unnamed protein product [Prorocentrum cordatum]|uniref:Uncharacterized protein n=1 Tax=Prorocentrum cordatum TaxID=2364126 RepID=A0ABN9T6F7_9DINO|nr:unnamed protein product [Polarella glacialis]